MKGFYCLFNNKTNTKRTTNLRISSICVTCCVSSMFGSATFQMLYFCGKKLILLGGKILYDLPNILANMCFNVFHVYTILFLGLSIVKTHFLPLNNPLHQDIHGLLRNHALVGRRTKDGHCTWMALLSDLTPLLR